jgi:indole-3-glycerol phosphate synthase
MNILEKIAYAKVREIESNRKKLPIRDLEESIFFKRPCISLRKALTQPGSSGIIAEIKRQSPSRGVIHADAQVAEIGKGYRDAGAAGISVLTDQEFFGGSGEDLVAVREAVDIPILRKEFIVDDYQVAEAKAMGADVVLLIAALLSPWEVMRLSSIAESIGMEVLLEVHNQQELEQSLSLNPRVHLLGVNNRNLQDFSVDIETSLRLAEMIPSQYVKVAESGISDPQKVLSLREAGFQGFLIGEHFMRGGQPHAICADFISQLQKPLAS